MALTQRGNYRYGATHADVHTEILEYSKANVYEAQHFADAVCKCCCKVFGLGLDDQAGVAIRICAACKTEHPIGDSADFMERADPGMCACPCGNEEFEISVGVSLYEDSEDVKWLYVGCRCPKCGLTAVYGDWKNEYLDYKELLARV
jgi:hypothetical protein